MFEVCAFDAMDKHLFLANGWEYNKYGSRAGVYRVLRLFKEYDIKATIYMVGKALQLNPQIGKIMQAQGHEITSHGWRWVDRSDWTEDEELQNAKQACRGEPGRHCETVNPVNWHLN